MTGFRSARTALLAALLACAAAGRARAQGVVLGPDGKPLAIKRVRALILFQERGAFPRTSREPNRQDLLVEIELAAPAPEGALWVLTYPSRAARYRPNASYGAAIEEVAAFWRREKNVPEEEPWPARPIAEIPGSPGAFGTPSVLPRAVPIVSYAGLETVRKKLARCDAGILQILEERSKAGWETLAMELAAGRTRTFPKRLVLDPLVAVYPGALGAGREKIDGRRAWRLPPLELMVLHPHFLNVKDNRTGLGPALGLLERYRDPGTLRRGTPLWLVPPARKPGGKPGPGRISRGRSSFPALEKLIRSAGISHSLFLTVVTGRPARLERSALDFRIRSHYPSAVETTGTTAGFAWLVACLAAFVVLMGFLLKRKGFAQ